MEALLTLLITLISAASGGIIGSVIKLKSEKQTHLFELKVKGYNKLIAAYRKLSALDKNNSDYEKYRQKYVEAQEQVELIGSDEVINISKKFYTEPPVRGPEIQKQLTKAMRDDLQHNRKF